jgi:hypothetical protein
VTVTKLWTPTSYNGNGANSKVGPEVWRPLQPSKRPRSDEYFHAVVQAHKGAHGWWGLLDQHLYSHGNGSATAHFLSHGVANLVPLEGESWYEVNHAPHVRLPYRVASKYVRAEEKVYLACCCDKHVGAFLANLFAREKPRVRERVIGDVLWQMEQAAKDLTTTKG